MMNTLARLGIVGLLSATACAAAVAQSYPVKPVRIIVPAGPGGPDIVARITAAKFTQQMGQTFYVENHGGANGIVGADMVAKAAPDGYTLMVYSSGIVINQFVNRKLPYDTANDFAPITNYINGLGFVLVAHPSLAAQSVKELIAHLKKNPGVVNISASAIGSAQHLAAELFKRSAGVDIVLVHYKGSGAILPDLLAGRVTPTRIRVRGGKLWCPASVSSLGQSRLLAEDIRLEARREGRWLMVPSLPARAMIFSPSNTGLQP